MTTTKTTKTTKTAKPAVEKVADTKPVETVAEASVIYAFTNKATRDINTKQKAGVAPSIRHTALSALKAAAGKDGTVTRAAALAVLASLPLGCSTPATRLAKFVRSGHLVTDQRGGQQ